MLHSLINDLNVVQPNSKDQSIDLDSNMNIIEVANVFYHLIQPPFNYNI
jgi:hypothetical protein